MDVFPKYVGTVGVIQYILSDRNSFPMDSRDVGDILRDEFGISGKPLRDIKRAIMSDLENVCYTVHGDDDCLECEDVKVLYRDRKQFELLHNELL